MGRTAEKRLFSHECRNRSPVVYTARYILDNEW